MADQRFEQRCPLTTQQRVRVETQYADLDIAWRDDDAIAVRGHDVEITSDEHEVRIERRQGRDRIEVWLPTRLAAASISTERGRLELQAALGEVEAHTGKGHIRLDGGQGSFSLRTGSGHIVAEAVDGPVSAKTGSGDVRLEGITGAIQAGTGSGDITASGGSGDLRGRTGSGNIRVERRGGDRVSLATGSGNVSLTGGRSGTTEVTTGSGNILSATDLGADRHTFTTGSGNIAVAVPRGLAVRIDANTSSGVVRSDLPLVSVNQRGPQSASSRRLVGSLGEGTPRAEISLRTNRGDLRLSWLEGSDADASTAAERQDEMTMGPADGASVSADDQASPTSREWATPAAPASAAPLSPPPTAPITASNDGPGASASLASSIEEAAPFEGAIPLPPPSPPAPGDAVAPAAPLPVGRAEPVVLPPPPPPPPLSPSGRVDQQRRVLEALADGAIDVADAARLLAALDEVGQAR